MSPEGQMGERGAPWDWSATRVFLLIFALMVVGVAMGTLVGVAATS